MNLGTNTAEAANFGLSDHIREVTGIPGYEYLVCASGLPRKTTHASQPTPACGLGYRSGVTHVELIHIEKLLEFEPPVATIPKRKAMKGRRAKEARWNPGKRHRYNNE